MSVLHKISNCENTSRKADVLFIHGLGGDAFKTWCHGEDASTSWPHWLGSEFADVGVWSLGYAASPTKWARLLRLFPGYSRDVGQSMPLPDRANQVLDLMVQREFGQRPLFLVCHSLGGLLAKQILRKAEAAVGEQRKLDVFQNTRAVLFLATPHAGAELATLLNMFRTVCGATVNIEDLREHDAHLRELFDWFRHHAQEHGICTRTYFETRGVLNVLPIVNPTSAHPGVGSDPVGLDEDHLSIAKPRSKDAQVYCAACDLLRDNVLSERPPRGPEGVIERRGATRAQPLSGLWPVIWTVPFPQNPYFKGRKEQLAELRSVLSGKVSAITQPQAIHGLGGIGKTQLAVEYAWQNRADYEAVFWVVADSPENAVANLAGLCRSTALNLPEAEECEQGVQLEAVCRWLREHSRWLLILDSVDTHEAAEYVRGSLDPAWKGHVIITSRRNDWHLAPSIAELPMPLLPLVEAVAFLRKRVFLGGFDAGAEDDALKIADELGRLPLALEQAASYMMRHRITFIEYLDRLHAARPSLLAEKALGGTHYPKAVNETWLITEMALSLPARAILRLTAFLGSDDIPRDLFKSESKVLAEAQKSMSPEFDAQTASSCGSDVAESALIELADYSLITLGHRAFSCHRLVQTVQSDRLDSDTRRIWVGFALQLVNDLMPPNTDDVRTWPVAGSLRSHAEMVIAQADRFGITKPTVRLMNSLALFYYTKALFGLAEPLMRRALAIAEVTYGPDHPNVAATITNLGLLLTSTNRLEDAEPLMRRALNIYEQSCGPVHLYVAATLTNLGMLLQDTNRPEEAESLMRRALTIFEQNYGADHRNVATGLNNLGRLLHVTGQSEEAEPLMRRALAIDEQSCGQNHPAVATDLNNLGRLLQDTNRSVEAEPLMRRALAIYEQSCGQDHPNVAKALNNLGLLFTATNRSKDAEPLMRRALTIDEKIYGPIHPNVAITLNNLGRLLQTSNRLGEAEPVLQRAVCILRGFGKRTGHEHPKMRLAIGNYRRLLEEMGLPKEVIRHKIKDLREMSHDANVNRLRPRAS